jgi:hypothetical protein
VLPAEKGDEVAKSFGENVVYAQVDISDSASVGQVRTTSCHLRFRSDEEQALTDWTSRFQGLMTVLNHFQKQLDAGSKLSGCVHCAGIAIKQVGTLAFSLGISSNVLPFLQV